MIFEYGVYKLDVDVDRTRQFYEAAENILCDCAGCRNFAKAQRLISGVAHPFFQQFGIDFGKPIEMSAINSADGNMTLYDGFYYICGTILAGKNPWQQAGENMRQLDAQYVLKPDDNLQLYFTEEQFLIDTDFPAPVVQMNVNCSIPWVLQEANPYHDPIA